MDTPGAVAWPLRFTTDRSWEMINQRNAARATFPVVTCAKPEPLTPLAAPSAPATHPRPRSSSSAWVASESTRLTSLNRPTSSVSKSGSGV